MKKSVPRKPRRFPATKQRRLDRLLEKNKEWRITPAEKAVLEPLVAEAEQWMAANAKRLVRFSKGETARPQAAVPVTVWVRAGQAGR